MPAHSDDAALADLLDLDAEALSAYWAEALCWLRQAASRISRARVLDLGAGSGVGTIALAQRFAGAEVVAVDASEEMLTRIRTKALGLGLAPRIRAVCADLDDAWPRLDPVDVTWASNSLHHLADPDRVLADVRATTRPGGLLAVAEFADPLRFLPDDLGFAAPGLEDRLRAIFDQHAESRPDLRSDWTQRVAAAGFDVLDERTFVIDVEPAPGSVGARYARQWFHRLLSGPADHLPRDDAEALRRLVDDAGPESLLRRTDLHVRGSRTVTLARRPLPAAG